MTIASVNNDVTFIFKTSSRLEGGNKGFRRNRIKSIPF